jgi:hypothetical protein
VAAQLLQGVCSVEYGLQNRSRTDLLDHLLIWASPACLLLVLLLPKLFGEKLSLSMLACVIGLLVHTLHAVNAEQRQSYQVHPQPHITMHV